MQNAKFQRAFGGEAMIAVFTARHGKRIDDLFARGNRDRLQRHDAVGAFLASGLTVVGGFAVLGLSSYPLLRDFGILVALNVSVALVCALAVPPPLLVWADANARFTRFPPGVAAARPAETLREEPATGRSG